MAETKLKVPLAHDEAKNLVRAENAERSIQYFCPSCGMPLILRKGEVKAPHFAHKHSETCSQETIIHIIAKNLIRQAVKDWKSEQSHSLILKRECQICRTEVEQPLPDKVEDTALEYRLATGFIADVALLVGGNPEAAIEVRVTHAVDEKKSAQIGIPFIEVDGQAIIEDSTTWTPIVDQFNPLTCPQCLDAYRKFESKTTQIARRSKMTLPTTYYRYAPGQCWRCKKEILFFT